MQITNIKIQQANPNKVSIFVDGAYSFSLTIEQLAEYKDLKIGSPLDSDRLKDLKILSAQNNIYISCLNLIYRRPRSKKEIITKLKLKKIDQSSIDLIIAKLQKAGHIDDANFARWWIEQRKTSQKSSKLKIKSELAQKGIDSKIIEEQLSEHFPPEDEMNVILGLIQKKGHKYSNDQKLITHLASKGFGYQQIKEAIQISKESSE
jgi:regulatory protein